MEGWMNLYDAGVFWSSKWRQAFEGPMILRVESPGIVDSKSLLEGGEGERKLVWKE